MPDLLLILIIAASVAGILLSIPIGGKAFRSMIKAAALVFLIETCALWRYHGSTALDQAVTDSKVKTIDGVQVVESTLSPGRYPNITVQAGLPVKWVIYAPEGSINGCNYRILIQEYDVEYTFHTGENVIEFTPDSSGTIRYSCWMGMIQGSIFVTD